MNKRPLPSPRTLGAVVTLVALSLVLAACGGTQARAAGNLSADGPGTATPSTVSATADIDPAKAASVPTTTTTVVTAATEAPAMAPAAPTPVTTTVDTADTAVDNQAAIDAANAAVADLDALLAGLAQDINSVTGDLAADAAATTQADN